MSCRGPGWCWSGGWGRVWIGSTLGREAGECAPRALYIMAWDRVPGGGHLWTKVQWRRPGASRMMGISEARRALKMTTAQPDLPDVDESEDCPAAEMPPTPTARDV